jgi:hypothetical protein
MKQEILTLVLIVLCVSGCAHMTVDNITDKYLFTISTDTKNTIYETENAKDSSKIEIILKGIVTNLDSKFVTKTTNSVRDNIIINIEIIDYNIMLKRIPPTRHWVTYKVDVIDNKNKKVLGSRIFEDGQPSISDIVEEMTNNIYTFCIQTIREKLN